MANDAIVGLVKDLTTQLSAIAVEFGARVDLVSQSDRTDEQRRSPRDLAAALLAQRTVRFSHFAAELFHEPAWDMLLALFVAHEEQRSMNIKALVACTRSPVTTSQRWIDHLHKQKLIERVADLVDRRRVDISLSHSGEQAVRAYLQQIVTT